MHLNTLSPAPGSKKPAKRLGRGIGSGLGKTAGRGHKGQRARSGGYHKVGFEGGQMPLSRRLPKFGFINLKTLTQEEVRLDALNTLVATEISLETLKEVGLLRNTTKSAKIMLAGEIKRAVTVSGVKVTQGAKAAIEAAGGKVEG